IDVYAFVFPDELLGLVEHGQGAKSQDVHLEKAEALEILSGKLRHDGAVRCLTYGRRLFERTRRDDDACRMHGEVARPSLHLEPKLDEAAQPIIPLDFGF